MSAIQRRNQPVNGFCFADNSAKQMSKNLKRMPRDILTKIFDEYLDVTYIYKMLNVPEKKLCIGTTMTYYMDLDIEFDNNWTSSMLFGTTKQEILRIINLYGFRPRDIISNLYLRNNNLNMMRTLKTDDVITVKCGYNTSCYHVIDRKDDVIEVQSIDRILDEKKTDINGNVYTQFLSNYPKSIFIDVDDFGKAESIKVESYKNLIFITNVVDLTENANNNNNINITQIINYEFMGFRQSITGDMNFMFEI